MSSPKVTNHQSPITNHQSPITNLVENILKNKLTLGFLSCMFAVTIKGYNLAFLKDIATIQSGVFLKPDKFGNAVYLQLNNYDYYGNLADNLTPNIFITPKQSKHVLQNGDLLFAAKGNYNFTAVYNGIYEKAVASSSFFVLRCKHNILPEYLAWFLNHNRNQKIFKIEAKGSSIPSITKELLGNLEINPIDINLQKGIIHIDRLQKKETLLINAINQLKNQFLEERIFNKIKI